MGMKRFFLIGILSIVAAAANAATKFPEGEWIIVVGGPSLYQW